MNVALEEYLKPLKPFLIKENVSEISVNVPGEVWVECRGQMQKHVVAGLTQELLKALAHLIAQSTSQEVSEEKPLLSATLPNGYRIQIVLPPVSQEICFSIRKPAMQSLSLEDYENQGLFDHTLTTQTRAPSKTLLRFYETKDIKAFLEKAILTRHNILISGGTSTGKTTFLNACLQKVPLEERLITVEDSREVLLPHANKIHLVSSRGAQGRARVSPQDLIEASLRLRPDRIIMGELRGAEAFSFLRAINTGHPGSIATLHADSPEMAFEQLGLMVMQADLNLEKTQIQDYIRRVIPIIVQLERGEGGKRSVSEIYFKEARLDPCAL